MRYHCANDPILIESIYMPFEYDIATVTFRLFQVKTEDVKVLSCEIKLC